MKTARSRHFGYNVAATHHWLQSRLLYPLVTISVVALGFFELWQRLIGPWDGPRLLLNLSLAWAPYLLALLCVAFHEGLPRWPNLYRCTFALWLLFFPNAPYLITDWHYLPVWRDEVWYAITMMTAFSVCGLLLATHSLYLIQTIVAVRQGRSWGMLTAVLAIGLSGLGVYLGRFLRLNSWDVLLRPAETLDTIREQLTTHPDHRGPAAFCMMFALVVGAFYYAMVDVRRAPRSCEEVAFLESLKEPS